MPVKKEAGHKKMLARKDAGQKRCQSKKMIAEKEVGQK